MATEQENITDDEWELVLSNHSDIVYYDINNIILNKQFHLLLNMKQFDVSILQHVLFKLCEDMNIIKHIIDNMHNLESRDINGWKLVHFICRYCDITMVQYIISKNVKLDDYTNDRNQPIHLIVTWQTIDSNVIGIIKHFINNKININTKNIVGYVIDLICMSWCARRVGLKRVQNSDENVMEVINLYITHNIPLNNYNQVYGSVLHILIEKHPDFHKSISKLLDMQIGIDVKNIHKEKPLQLICKYTSASVLESVITNYINKHSYANKDIYELVCAVHTNNNLTDNQKLKFNVEIIPLIKVK